MTDQVVSVSSRVPPVSCDDAEEVFDVIVPNTAGETTPRERHPEGDQQQLRSEAEADDQQVEENHAEPELERRSEGREEEEGNPPVAPEESGGETRVVQQPRDAGDEARKFDWNAWFTCVTVSFTSFFLLNYATYSVDLAVQSGWMKGSSLFGVSCGNGHSLPIIPNKVATNASEAGEGHDDMQRDFIVWGLYGLAAAGLVGLIVATVSALCGAINKVERYAREIVKASSALMIVAGGLMLLMWARLFDPCRLFRWARLLAHFGMTLSGLVGIPFLYGNTRRSPHPDQQHLMGGIAVAIVLGELCGFLAGTYTEEWTWLAISAVVTISVALLPFAEFRWKAMTTYGELDAAVQDKANEEDKFRFTWTFWAMVLRASLIWAFIDIPRHIFRCAFELFLDKIGDHEGASTMHVAGSALAILWCLASIGFNMFILSCSSWRACLPRCLLRHHGVDMAKLAIACVVAFSALLAVVILDARAERTRSWDIGIPMFFYLPAVAVAIEQMLEFLPYLFPRRAFFIGWVYTVLLRYAIRLLITTYIPNATNAWPIWLIISIALLSSAVSPIAVVQSVFHRWCHVDDFIAPHSDFLGSKKARLYVVTIHVGSTYDGQPGRFLNKHTSEELTVSHCGAYRMPHSIVVERKPTDDK